MASIIEGYTNDIFISYRQKDNKGDRWVSEFVDALKDELESTFKEEISVYFDINPHDGLLETHDVDESLKEKLKCLVFIPVISRTYCDPKSFAWEHEFKVFVEQASEDQFGLKVKLPGGNVASRILPVLIYDLDNDDIMLCESILGGVLRGIEFIYKEPGVNRPLSPDDDTKENLNKTKYRNQVNKVANGIKEIITGLRNYDKNGVVVSKKIIKVKPVSTKNLNPRIIIGSFIVVLLIALGYFIIPKLFNPVENSIAVLPFLNDNPDEDNLYVNSFTEEIRSNLQKINNLRVIGRISSEYYNSQSLSPAEIAKNLGVNYLLQGSGRKIGDAYNLNVSLTLGANANILWTKRYQVETKDVNDLWAIYLQIAEAIANELKAVITPEEKQLIEKPPTADMEAYDAYQLGRFYWRKLTSNDLSTALQYFELAKEKDPNYALAYAGICYYWLGAQQMGIVSPAEAIPKAVEAGMKALELDSTSAQVHYTLALLNAWGLWDWKASEKEFKKTIALNPNDAEPHAYYSRFLHILRRPEEAMKEIEIALNLDPRNPLIKSIYGLDLMSIHRYDDAIKEYKEALKGDPTAPVALKNLPIALYLTGREKEALQEYRMVYKSPEILQALNDGYVKADYIGAMSHVADALVEQSKTTWVKPTLIAVHYTQAGNKDKAIDWLEKAFQEHDPNLPYLLNPIYDSLRNDPRFKNLLRKLNLPDNN